VKVVHFQRKKGLSFSLEGVFETVRAHFPDGVEAEVRSCPFPSRGLFRRLANVLWAALHRGEVNHVTGDVHYLALGLPRRRTVLTVADCGVVHRSAGVRRFLLRLFWYDLPVRRAAVVTTISEESRRDLLALVPCSPGKVRVVPCPVDPAFVPEPRPFREERPRILQVGAKSNKNLERLAAALEGIPCVLEVVGKLDEEQTASLDRRGVRWENRHGLTFPEMRERYRECDLLVCVSTFEGFGLPILEAQATGRPVVTSRVSSMPEVAGDGACLVDPFEVTSIREGIDRVIRERPYREELVRKGFRNVERFRPESVAREYHRIYRELLEGAGEREQENRKR
jgi:glycosyltransferase involved in cell wall biosynthesis